MNRLVVVIGAMVVAGGSLRAIPRRSATAQAPASQKTGSQKPRRPEGPAAKPVAPAELDHLLAPVALYPDSLLAQILQCAQKPWRRSAPWPSGWPASSRSRAARCRMPR